MQNYRIIRTTPSGRKVTQAERKKRERKNADNCGHFFVDAHGVNAHVLVLP
jgi:ribosomal protein L34E